jgi:hypothetical protein
MSSYSDQLVDLVLEVTIPGGTVLTREYVNALRTITGKPEMDQESYETGAKSAAIIGRQMVKMLHQEARFVAMYGPRDGTP